MIKIIIGVSIMVGVLNILFPPVEVCGNSMFPTYRDKELILGTRLYLKRNLKRGDVILYKTEDERIVIKRINHIKTKGKDLEFYCLGDNSKDSYDSRHYGFVSSKQLVCKALKSRPKKI